MSGTRSPRGSGNQSNVVFPGVLPMSTTSGSRPGYNSPPRSPRGNRSGSSNGVVPVLTHNGSGSRSPSRSSSGSYGAITPVTTLPVIGSNSGRYRAGSQSPPVSPRGTTLSSYTPAPGTISPRMLNSQSSPVKLVNGTPVPLGPSVQPIREHSGQHALSQYSNGVAALPTTSPNYKPHKVRVRKNNTGK